MLNGEPTRNYLQQNKMNAEKRSLGNYSQVKSKRMRMQSLPSQATASDPQKQNIWDTDHRIEWFKHTYSSTTGAS